MHYAHKLCGRVLVWFMVGVFLPSGLLAQLGQLPPFTRWYQNPLGVSPLNLHTGNAILLPALAGAAILLFTAPDSTLPNRVAYFTEAGSSFSYFGPQAVLHQNNTGLLYSLRKYMAVGVELTSYYAHDALNNTWGFGIRPFVRWYPLNRNGVKLFVESGAGLILFTNEYPQPTGFFGDNRTGTRLNGSPKYGIGAEFKVGRSLWLQGGLRHIHISNGNWAGAERNPGHDSNGFFVGVLYRPIRQ